MDLGAFSISLAVKDLAASRAFYEALGFSSLGGNPDHGYLILKNGDTVIGLFQGMFEKNVLTFNPGWDSSAQNVEPFTDVRALHARLTEAGLQTTQETNLDGTGPASFVLVDPDGNPVLVDQHR
jgi:catechol 2,3-dioxygenase-like lactoylglutathione lyase family enzyme